MIASKYEGLSCAVTVVLSVALLSCSQNGPILFEPDIPILPQVQLKQQSDLQTLLEEKLHSLVKPEESMWSLHKGECLQVGAGVCAVYHVVCHVTQC